MNESLVRLRPIEREDLRFLCDLANDPEVRANVVGWDWPLSFAGQEEWFTSTLKSDTTRRFLVESHNGEPLGLTGFWDIDWRSRNAMTALKLGGSVGVRGRGYGTSAIHEIMRLAFTDVGLNRLHSTVLASNTRSLAAYVRKSGWTEEGRLRQHVWHAGNYEDLIQIGITKSDYEAMNLQHAEHTAQIDEQRASPS